MLYDPATVEACAKVLADMLAKAKDKHAKKGLGKGFPGRLNRVRTLGEAYAAIRSLAGREIQSSDGGKGGNRPTDPIEQVVFDALSKAGIKFTQNDAGLDFHLPDFGVHIECKQFHTPRISEQGSRASDVIVVQGRKSAALLAILLTNSAGAWKAPHRGPSAGESDPVVRQDCAPAGTAREAINRLRAAVENMGRDWQSARPFFMSAKYPDEQIAEDIKTVLAVVAQPSPSQPGAGLTEDEWSKLQFNRGYLEQVAAHSDEGPIGEVAAKSLLNIATQQLAIIDRLTSSPVSEEELAKRLCAAAGGIWTSLVPGQPGIAGWKECGLGTQWFWLNLARALLSQFSIGRM